MRHRERAAPLVQRLVIVVKDIPDRGQAHTLHCAHAKTVLPQTIDIMVHIPLDPLPRAREQGGRRGTPPARARTQVTGVLARPRVRVTSGPTVSPGSHLSLKNALPATLPTRVPITAPATKSDSQ